MSVNTVGLSTTYSTSLASLRKQGDQLTSGVVQGDVGVDAVVNSFAKNMAVSSAYVKNMASGLSYFNVAKTYLEGIRDTLVSMSQQAIQAASSTGTQLAVLNAQFTGLQATLAQVLTNANYDGTQLFTNANSVSVVVADGNTTITGSLITTALTPLANDPSIRSSAPATAPNTTVPLTLANNSGTLTIFGTATVAGANGSAAGVANAGTTITLNPGSYAVVTNAIGGQQCLYDSNSGAITVQDATLQYSNNTLNLSNAANAAVTVTGGSFVVNQAAQNAVPFHGIAAAAAAGAVPTATGIMTIIGSATIVAAGGGGNAGTNAGVTGYGGNATLTLSAGSYAYITAGNGGAGNGVYDHTSGAIPITVAGMQYSDHTVDFSGANPVTVTGGTFTPGATTNLHPPVLSGTTGNQLQALCGALLSTATGATSGVGGAIGTINTATGTITSAGTNIASTASAEVALAFVSGAIDTMNQVISQIDVVSSSLSTYSGATSQNIVSISEAKEALESANPVDVLGAMSANTNTMNATLTLLVAEQGVQDKVTLVAEHTLS